MTRNRQWKERKELKFWSNLFLCLCLLRKGRLSQLWQETDNERKKRAKILIEFVKCGFHLLCTDVPPNAHGLAASALAGYYVMRFSWISCTPAPPVLHMDFGLGEMDCAWVVWVLICVKWEDRDLVSKDFAIYQPQLIIWCSSHIMSVNCGSFWT